MDRASLREGGVVRMWVSAQAQADGGEVMYAADLPSCCRREARSADDAFECVSCGAIWQAAEELSCEECAFVVEEREERGAA